VTYDLTAASMDVLVDATNPDDGSRFMLSGKTNNVATQAAVSMPVDRPPTPR
jgi:hypothetical protein